MRATRFLIVLLLLSLPASASAEDADDWKIIGGVLGLMQQALHVAAHSPDPCAAQKNLDTILSGENAQANRLAAEVMDEILRDVPAAQRGVFVAIGRDLLVLARRERARAGSESCRPGMGN